MSCDENEVHTPNSDISGLKARDMTAWGEAQRAKPQVNVRKENPFRAESAVSV
jgi:hypothetical protein